ncbi:RIB43A-like with coiled-coils protein 2 [Thalassophryne amazonica]|uniref:RIB43A-like with coiled-coils protein 2 n=1 Tax=Thalassophryne amazonica TaxID=390379 RepID=UPI0014713A5E|nr:RIB43A-like with coiled-coils protein 2 [Thalassophryne amazonica]
MINFELISDRAAAANLEMRRHRETQRKERMFNEKVRTIGIDKETLDMQIKEKKQQEEAEREKQREYDGEMLQNTKTAHLLHKQQMNQKYAMEKAIVDYRHQYQQHQCQRENDELCGKTVQDGAGVTLPGLLGEDPDRHIREKKQKEQLREWLGQQQRERAAAEHQQRLEEQNYEQNRREMEIKALQHHNANMENRKAATVATKEYNFAKWANTEEQRRHQQQLTDDTSALNMSGLPGLSPSSDRRAPEDLQQIIQFHKIQIEEKKKTESQQKQEEEQYHRICMDSARRALLLERQQAKLQRQLRRDVDSTNTELAKTRDQQRQMLKRGSVEDSFFSQFNTCSR